MTENRKMSSDSAIGLISSVAITKAMFSHCRLLVICIAVCIDALYNTPARRIVRTRKYNLQRVIQLLIINAFASHDDSFFFLT